MPLRNHSAVLTVMVGLALAVPAAAPAFSSVELDSSFGSSGRVLTALPRGARRVQTTRAADGDLLVMRSTTLARYKSDGRLDLSFGNAGVVTVPLPAGARFSLAGLEVDPLGRVIVAGTLFTFNQTTYVPAEGPRQVRHEQALLVRLLPDGTLDPAFGSGSILIPIWGYRHRPCRPRKGRYRRR